MFLDCVEDLYAERREARQVVRRALSEEAAEEARGKVASNCDDRFIFGRGEYVRWEISRVIACDGTPTSFDRQSRPRASLGTGLGFLVRQHSYGRKRRPRHE
jgi:hypothetical protein